MNWKKKAGFVFGVIILIALIGFVATSYYDPPGPPNTETFLERDYLDEDEKARLSGDE